MIALVALPHGIRTAASRRAPGAAGGWSADRGFLLFLAAVFVTAAVYMQNASTFALHVVALGYSTKIYGLLPAMNGVGRGAVRAPDQRVDPAPPRTRMIALGALLVGVGFAGGLANT